MSKEEKRVDKKVDKKPEESKKTSPTKKREVEQKLPTKTERPIPAWAYCNIVGLSSGVAITVKKRFGHLGRKTIKEWKEIFTKGGLV